MHITFFFLPSEFSSWKLSELPNLKNKNQLMVLEPGDQGTTILESTLRIHLSVSKLEFK
jgi:hypothetical protein